MSVKFAPAKGPIAPHALGGKHLSPEEITAAARARMRRDRGIHRRIARGMLSHEELHEYIADKRAIPMEAEE